MTVSRAMVSVLTMLMMVETSEMLGTSASLIVM